MLGLPWEEVYLSQYRDLEDARASFQRFIEEVYNRKRLHSALGYLSPEAFESGIARAPLPMEDHADEFSKA